MTCESMWKKWIYTVPLKHTLNNGEELFFRSKEDRSKTAGM